MTPESQGGTMRVVRRAGRYAAILVGSLVIAVLVMIVADTAGVNWYALAE